MFNLTNFIKKNIVDGVKNGSFTREGASIKMVDYLSKGYVSKADIDEVDKELSAFEEEKDKPVEVTEPSESEKTNYVTDEANGYDYN